VLVGRDGLDLLDNAGAGWKTWLAETITAVREPGTELCDGDVEPQPVVVRTLWIGL
jgi:hypothetical protein